MFGRRIVIGFVVCVCGCLGTAFAQEVEIPRDKPATAHKVGFASPKVEIRSGQPIVELVKATPPKLSVEEMREAGSLAAQHFKEEMHEVSVDEEEVQAVVPKPAPTTIKPAIAVKPVPVIKPATAVAQHPADHHEPEPPVLQPNLSGQTAFIQLADGFDLPVGKPNGQGYYKAQGFQSHGHLGEDWDGVGGGNTDFGDPIYCIGDGIVVFARDCHMGWGNVVIVRHAYRDGSSVKNVDSLYGHLDKIMVKRGQAVRRGQQIATMGTAHGLYDSHLHLEIRKNLMIGMSRDKFAKDGSNYFDPSQFITTHRHLQNAGKGYRVAMNTFIYDSKIRWDKLHNYAHAHTGGGSAESSLALKKALATSQTRQ